MTAARFQAVVQLEDAAATLYGNTDVRFSGSEEALAEHRAALAVLEELAEAAEGVLRWGDEKARRDLRVKLSRARAGAGHEQASAKLNRTQGEALERLRDGLRRIEQDSLNPHVAPGHLGFLARSLLVAEGQEP